MDNYFLTGLKGEKRPFSLPEGWRVLTNAALEATKTKKTVYDMVVESIGKPTACAPLADLVKGEGRILIIVDDLTRPTPKRALLEPVLGYLRQHGVESERVDVLIGLGTHRPLSPSEIEATFGEKLCGQVRILNHNCRADDLVSVGTLPCGGELKIHPLAARADLRIALGSILPHPFAGFGGGAKAVLPGIAGYDVIRKHHCALMAAPRVELGNMDNNPFYREVCEAAALARLDFVVNLVYDADEDVKAVVSGHFRKAHELGAAMCVKELGVPFGEGADVTVLSAFPYSEGPQILKPLGIANMVTKKGGRVILFAPEIKGGRFPEQLLQAFDTAFSMSGGDVRRLVLDLLSQGRPIMPDAPMDFNAALNTGLLFSTRVKTLLVSKDADPRQAARLGFGYASSLEDALAEVSRDLPEATVHILPSGGLTLPLVAEAMKFTW